MARPKGPRAKAKATKSPAPAGVGHNDLTDEQKAALLLQGVGRIERLLADQAKITADIRNERKKLKADGFAPAQVNYALWLRKADEGEASERMRMQITTAKWLAHPIGHQTDMFGDGVDRTPGVDKAFAEGKTAGMAGEAQTVPDKWAPGSEQGQKWLEGWSAGQAVLLSGIKPLSETDEDFDDSTSGRPSMRSREFSSEDGGLGDAPQRTSVN